MEKDEKKARQAEILVKARAAAKAKREARKLASEAAVPEAPLTEDEQADLVQVSTDPSGSSAAHAIAMSQGAFMQRDVSEVPTGKTIKVQRAAGYKVVGHRDDGREIIKPVFRTVTLPTYFYKIDMPPCGGTDLKINGTPYYHGGVYELDLDTLRTVKEMVNRLWKHDSEIHGSDENFYRKQSKPTISARGMR